MKCGHDDCFTCPYPDCIIDSIPNKRASKSVYYRYSDMYKNSALKYYYTHQDKINFWSRVRRKISKMEAIKECSYCHSKWDPSKPVKILKFHKNYFCCEECARNYMYALHRDDIKEFFKDTRENIMQKATAEWEQIQNHETQEQS